MKNASVVGVDIGGSHVAAAAVNAATGEVLPASRTRQAIDARNSADEIIRVWCNVIEKASVAVTGEVKIGLAVPGPFDYEAGVCLIEAQDKFRQLYGFNVKEALAQRMKISASAIRFVNDAAAFLQGEVLYGAGRGRKNVLGLTLGTGLGSALCTNGACTDAGLWQSSFKEGMAEDCFSTRWFVQAYRSLSGRELPGVKEVLQAVNSEERVTLFSTFGNNLGEFLLPLIKKHKTKAVIFGGNISQAKDLFFPAVKTFLQRHRCKADLLGSALGEDAALLGAAGCWNESPTTDAATVKGSVKVQ